MALTAEETPQRRAVRGEPFEMRFAAGADGAPRHFEARGMPIDGGDVGGVPVTREGGQRARDGSR